MKRLADMNTIDNNHAIKPAFIIVERDLQGRYPDVEKFCCDKVHVIDIQTILGFNIFTTIYQRFKSSKFVRKKIDLIPESIINSKVIFLSNTEGYIAKNLVEKIRKENSDAVIISLQHGLFLLDHGVAHRLKKYFLSILTKMIAGIDLIGGGFVNRKVDFYVVYNNEYKSQLVAAGCNPSRIIVSTETLKGLCFWRRQKITGLNSDSIIFILQPLSALGLLPKEDEIKLVNGLIEILSRSYKHIYIKQHPYRDVAGICINDNCHIVSESLITLANVANNAISFFSEALNELEFLGLNVYAVYDKKIKVKKCIYNQFRSTVMLQQGELVEISTSKSADEYYQSEGSLSYLYKKIVELAVQ